jgi:hypothetical protein
MGVKFVVRTCADESRDDSEVLHHGLRARGSSGEANDAVRRDAGRAGNAGRHGHSEHSACLSERLVGVRLLKDTPMSFAFETGLNRCRRDPARAQRCEIEKRYVELRGTRTSDCAH